MFKTFPRGFVLVGLELAAAGMGLVQAQEPRPSSVQKAVQSSVQNNDPRFHVLENFFAARHCPVRQFAKDFLLAADQNGLDWRLLPSISLIESGGGKNHRNNNIFGWNSGRHHFASIQASIYATAAKLAHSKIYRNKNTEQILRTYNKRPQWGERVKAVMRAIGSIDMPPTVAELH